jgi:hypothetical protein
MVALRDASINEFKAMLAIKKIIPIFHAQRFPLHIPIPTDIYTIAKIRESPVNKDISGLILKDSKEGRIKAYKIP